MGLGWGFYQPDQDCGFTKSTYIGFTKLSTHPVQNIDITLDLTQVGFTSNEEIAVYDFLASERGGQVQRLLCCQGRTTSWKCLPAFVQGFAAGDCVSFACFMYRSS